MIIEHELVFTKIQLKMFDCWYACTMMIRSAACGSRVTSLPGAAEEHRSRPILGRKLAFAGSVGTDIIRENDLLDVSGKLKLNDIESLYRCLQSYGPIIACGKFAIFNTQCHCIVISGCDTVTGNVSIYDPGWAQGKQTKPYTYIAEYCGKMLGDAGTPAACTFIADNPHWEATPTRARSA